MAILINEHSRCIIQGMTGHTGRNLASKLLDEGSPLVAGVSPGRSGQRVRDLPIYDSCYDAVIHEGCDASFVCVPAMHALAAVLEAIDAGLKLVVVYAEGVPILDAVRMAAYARTRGTMLIGPNAAGCISPGLANLSDLSAEALQPGRIGIVSKSGTLTYEAIDELNRCGFGQSTVACLGGDPVIGTQHRPVLELFETDDQTDAVVLIGEIGGLSEIEASDFIDRMTKPVIAYITGRHAPAGKRMGHAGALIGGELENVPAKQARLKAAGAIVVNDLTQIGDAVQESLASRTSATASPSGT